MLTPQGFFDWKRKPPGSDLSVSLSLSLASAQVSSHIMQHVHLP